MSAPPLSLGAVQETITLPSSSIAAFTAVGAPGTVRGVTPSEGTEYAPTPAAFTAATAKVYSVPFVNSLTCASACADSASSKMVQTSSTQ